jgi:lysophospholipase L1-like esterase
MSKFFKVVLVLVLLGANNSFCNVVDDVKDPNSIKECKTEKKSKLIISADDSRIKIHGAKFTKMVNGEMIMHRHTDKMYEGSTNILRFNPEKAKSSTGISIRFKTKSPSVKVNLRISEEVLKKKPASSDIGIFQELNSISIPHHSSPVKPITPNDKYRITYEIGKAFTINVVSENVGSLVEYKITLPIFIDINLVGLELESGYDLVDYTEEIKPVYVAYGNSITHGRAQNATYETYPYLISEWMNWELYNIAVGGGKTSKYMAEMIRDKFTHIDYMTVLIGYNDYAGGGESTKTYTANYTEFLDIARDKHPNTIIYCLTLTATTTTTSPESDVKAEEFRQVVRDVVKARQKAGDNKIFLIEGEDISSIADLKKKVHFTVEGALRVADKLYLEINKTLSTETTNNKKVGVNIYPNPATDTLMIDCKSNIEYVRIYDLSGKKVMDINLKKNNESIDISKLKAGTYLLSATSDYKTSTISFIKK